MKKVPRHIVRVLILFIFFIISNIVLLFELQNIFTSEVSRISTRQILGIPFLAVCVIVFSILCVSIIIFMVISSLKDADIEIARLKSKGKDKKQKIEVKEILDEANAVEKRVNSRLNKLLSELPSDNCKIFTEKVLINVSKDVEIVQGLFYVKNTGTNTFSLKGTYAFYSQEEVPDFAIGEGIIGQVAKNCKVLNINNVPDDYITILSGLGSSSPKHLCVVPVLYNQECIGVFELASFRRFDSETEEVFNQLTSLLGEQLLEVIKNK